MSDISKGKKGKAFLQISLMLISILTMLVAISPTAMAAADTVSLKDGSNNDITVVGNNSVVMINVNDGTTTGGTKTATVVQQGTPANTISVTIYDDGAIPGDIASDGTYLGMFNVTDSASA